jgi:hypothetical protein
MRLKRFLIILCLALVAMLGVAIWFTPSSEDFRVENPSWNGAGELDTDIPSRPLYSLANLPQDARGDLLVLVPYTPLSEGDLARVKGFLTQGGTLFLADDYGYGNEVLDYLGVPARFAGVPLLDPLFNYKNQRLPCIFYFVSNTGITESVRSLVLNHATALSGVTAEQVIATSSTSSFLDQDGNGQKGSDEMVGQFPVISQLSYGESKIVLLADPSLLINSMEALGDNKRLRQNIAGLAAGDVYFDQSHLPPSNLTGAKNTLGALRDTLAYPAVTLVLVVALVAGLLVAFWQRKGDRVEQRDRQ